MLVRECRERNKNNFYKERGRERETDRMGESRKERERETTIERQSDRKKDRLRQIER